MPSRPTRTIAAAGCAVALTATAIALAADGTDPSGDGPNSSLDIVSYSATRADAKTFAASATFADPAVNDGGEIRVFYGLKSGNFCSGDGYFLRANRKAGAARMNATDESGENQIQGSARATLSSDGKTVSLEGVVPAAGGKYPTDCAQVVLATSNVTQSDSTTRLSLPRVEGSTEGPDPTPFPGTGTPTPTPTATATATTTAQPTTTAVPTATPDPVEPGSKCEKAKKAKSKAGKKLNKLKKNDGSKKAIKKAKKKLAAAKKAVKRNC